MSSNVAQIKGLSHHYGDVISLDDISLDIPASKTIGIIGPDGVGKSTLLSIIAGVRKIADGEVAVLNGNIKDKKFRNKIYPKIAYMPQGLGKNLYMSLSVYENIEFFGRLFGQSKQRRESRIIELLKSTGLYNFKDRPAGKLSGGMKQKLGLCCALIHDPELLILDEPTTGVDPLSRRQFWDLVTSIKNRNKNMSVLVATAYMQEAEKFDYIIAMDEGKILSQSTPLELLEKTNSNTIDEAFINLLPKYKKEEHIKLENVGKEFDCNIVIEAENLTMRFGDFTAVDSVSFNIKEGEIFGFLGSNGCGKTTTMKMLTGLLIPTKGNAKLFGEYVKENSLKMREKVGYMTQAFSLYNELTVRQNLELHGKLFHIEKSQLNARLQQMLEKFNLKKYEHSLAEGLPLGIKQRLSLAAAVIHRPKMLILDEPTSGVDPISRDIFWKLLIDLSRNDNVTIFISTHFMNEGERCDRISLMHQGKVLASNTPKELIKAKEKENLEEAFISYLEEAVPKDESEKNEIEINKEEKEDKKNQNFKFMRLYAYCYKEFLEVIRDPIRLTFALLGTVILMFVMGYGISMDVEDLRFSVYDQDKTPQSRNYIQNISGSRYFLEQKEISSQSELDRRMKSGELSVAFVIPPLFGKNLNKGYEQSIAVWIDGAMPFRAETIKGYIQGLNNSYLQQVAKSTYGIDLSLNVNVELRYRYNQAFKSIYAIVPAVIPMLLIFIPSILMALSIVREKELGSITNFYATPVSKFEFLIGKQIPYVIISMISFFGLILLTIIVFEVPLKGSIITLLCAAFLYVIVTTGIGLFMSSFAKTQIAALTGTAILSLLPTIQFSGLKEPVSSLEGVGAFMGDIFPVTYFINISRGVFSKALEFKDLYFDFTVLGISIFVIIFFSIVVLKKQEA